VSGRHRLAALIVAIVALTTLAIVHPNASFATVPSLSNVTIHRSCPPASPPRYYTSGQDYFTPAGFVDDANGMPLHLTFHVKNVDLRSADFTPDSDHFALGPAEKIASDLEVALGPTPMTISLQLQDSNDLTIASASVAVNGCPSGLATDFDGDGRDDLVVFRPSNGDWYANDLTTSAYSSTVHNVKTHFGTKGDVPVPADYNGDGLTDYAVFRPSSGNWHFSTSATVHFGQRGDIPVPGFYLDDNTLSLAVFRPSSGTWFVRGRAPVHWGTKGDIPVPADFNGNGMEDLIVYRPSTGVWYDHDDASQTTHWGASQDVPLPGDYGAAGWEVPYTVLSATTFRPSNGTWYEQNVRNEQFGRSGDIPVPLDYSGGCFTTEVVFRPSTGTWYVSGTGAVRWGANGDIPIRPVAPCTGTLLEIF
jgi:hypothetical protein